MYTIDFDPKLEKTLKKWKKSNPNLFKKLTKILLAIQEDPRHGIGHPEPLVKGSDTDCRTMRLVYRPAHTAFKHRGGVANAINIKSHF